LGGFSNFYYHLSQIATASMLIDINGDSLPDRVFDRNPANDQQGFYVYLNTVR
jgi:hypothetical protein